MIKRWLNRFFEVKAGIMLAQPTTLSRACNDNIPTEKGVLIRTSQYRKTMPWRELAFDQRRLEGHTLYELWVGEQPVCYGWVAEPGTRVGILHDLHLRVPNDGFYIWDCATSPSARGKGYFCLLLRALVEGTYPDARQALVAVDTGNSASRRALQKAGFQPLFRYISARMMGRSLFSLAIRKGRPAPAQAEFDGIADPR